ALMTLGQVSELLVLVATPWLIKRFGLRRMFFCGVVAWVVRYSLLTAASYFHLSSPVIAAILIHGACYVFVYVIGVMYVDHLVAGQHRGAAQGLYSLASAGLGNLAGAFSVGLTQSIFLTPEGVSPPPYNWPAFWIVPAVVSIVTVLVFWFAFHSKSAAHD